MKIQIRIDHFYRQLNMTLELNTVKIIESIFDVVLTQGKSKFLENYVKYNSESFLSIYSSHTLPDIVWLFDIYINNLND
jgi:hypothetical protein